MNIGPYNSLSSRIGFLPALIAFVSFALKFHYGDIEVEAFYVELEKFYKESHIFCTVVVGKFNAKIMSKNPLKNFMGPEI